MRLSKQALLYRRKPRGIAFAYILGAIALLTIATTFISKTQRGMAQSTFNTENRNILLDQYSLIRSRAIGCVVAYPAGDNGTGFRPQFPGTPVSRLVTDMTCPGQPGSNNLWSGTGGLTLPAVPRSFMAWRYNNDATNIRLTLTTAVADDPAALGVMDSIVKRVGTNASRTGDVLTIVLAV